MAARRTVRVRPLLAVAGLCALLAVSLASSLPAGAGPNQDPAPRGVDPAQGIQNLDHLIFIVQENRSFDSYFGTFPGANGIPTEGRRIVPCLRARPDDRREVPQALSRHRTVRCRRSARWKASQDLGQPRPDERLHPVAAHDCSSNGARPSPTIPVQEGGQRAERPPDVMGYHTSRRSRTTGSTPSATRCRIGCSRPATRGPCRPTCSWSRAGRRPAPNRNWPDELHRSEVPGATGADGEPDLDPADGRTAPVRRGPPSPGCSTRPGSTGATTWDPTRASHRPCDELPGHGDRAGAEPAARVLGTIEPERQARQRATQHRVLRRGGRRHAAAGLLGHAHHRAEANIRRTTSGTARPGSPSSSTP